MQCFRSTHRSVPPTPNVKQKSIGRIGFTFWNVQGNAPYGLLWLTMACSSMAKGLQLPVALAVALDWLHWTRSCAAEASSTGKCPGFKQKTRGVERSADPQIHRTSIDLLLRLGTEGSKQPALNSVSSCAWLNLWRKLWKAEKLVCLKGCGGFQSGPSELECRKHQCFCDCKRLWEYTRFRQSRTKYHACTTSLQSELLSPFAVWL